jgi:hypothetical protein
MINIDEKIPVRNVLIFVILLMARLGHHQGKHVKLKILFTTLHIKKINLHLSNMTITGYKLTLNSCCRMTHKDVK